LQLRSLDLSQNTLRDERGDETAELSRLTNLECLKLANCRLARVRPGVVVSATAESLVKE
jgi:Leucine-rich repeat (LRR) protein